MSTPDPDSDPGAPRPSADAPPPETAGAARRNFLLGAASGAIGTVAFDFIHPDLILTGMVYVLTLPVYGKGWALALVSLVSILNKGGSLLPQLYVGSLLEHHPRKRPFYGLIMAARLVGAAGMLLAMAMLARRVDAASLGLFFAAFLVASVCMGAGHVVSMDMVGRMIRFQRVGSFLGTRDFWGGLLSLVAGVAVVQPILGRGGEGRAADVVAWNYFWLVAVGGVLTAASMTLFILCREQAGPRAKHRTTVGQSLVRGWRWLTRNPDYRAYLWLRIAFRFTNLGLTFFIPYGEEKLRSAADAAGVAMLGGLMVATFKLSRVVSAVVWGWMSDRRGDRAVLVGTGAGFTLGPALALAAPLLPPVFRVPLPMTGMGLDLPLAVYLAGLAAIGAAFQGNIIGGNRFLIGRAPPRRRLSYMGFLNTVTSPLTLLPFGAAAVAGYLGENALFALIVGGGLLFLVWALRLRPEADRLDAGAGDVPAEPPA